LITRTHAAIDLTDSPVRPLPLAAAVVAFQAVRGG
jgi:hypothetical protein